MSKTSLVNGSILKLRTKGEIKTCWSVFSFSAQIVEMDWKHGKRDGMNDISILKGRKDH